MTIDPPHIISRDEARARGLKRYFTGTPCKHGHIAERNVRSGRCLECDRARTTKWRAANPKRIRETKRKYRAANLEKLREKDREVARKQYIKNRGKILSKRAAWRAENKEETAAYRRQWYAKNKDRLAAKRAAKRGALRSALHDRAHEGLPRKRLRRVPPRCASVHNAKGRRDLCRRPLQMNCRARPVPLIKRRIRMHLLTN